MLEAHETNTELLYTSVSEVLETMAFMMVMPPDEPLPTPTTSMLVSMRFQGTVSGCIELAAGQKLVQMIAANFLGVEPDDPQAGEKSIDAFKEVLNTVCGVLLPRLAASENDVFDITIPECEQLASAQDWENLIRQADVQEFDCEGHSLAMRMTSP